MDEDLAVINSNTRNEKIKNFFINNKKKLLFLITFLILILLSYFGYNEYKIKNKIKISNLYNSTVINYTADNKDLTIDNLIKVINKKDPTYSPLSLYFIIDNNLISEKDNINNLFDIIIEDISLEKEIKNLLIYKKGLYNSDTTNESDLLDILNPLIKSKSVWSSHALYLVAEYYYFKNEKQKSKEFFNKILNLENGNHEIIKEAQKRLNRDLSE
tara:strand:+ start:1422 stop:2066 length:645 start_codon:yes stop_codon:yes gene_type:complete